jgi:peptidoglycan hydrolase CwlO-like protein
MKQVQALIAAVLVTGLVAIGMLSVGASALANTNTVPVSDSPAASVSNDSGTAPGQNADPSQQIQQLQNLVRQYQDREQQYQSRLNQAAQQIQQYQSQLNEASQQVEQLQSILAELQNRGVIRILNDGTIQIGRGFGRREN